MSQLTLYSQFNMRKPYLVSSNIEDVAGYLADDGVRFEHIPVKHGTAHSQELSQEFSQELSQELSPAQLLALYESTVQAFKEQLALAHADVVSFSPRVENTISVRDKYLSEHTHTGAEARYFLSGKALYYIHANERIHIVQCGAGDFIMLPKGMKHWFDMGPKPEYCCIRWYNHEDDLITHFTGSYVAESTPRWETMIGD